MILRLREFKELHYFLLLIFTLHTSAQELDWAKQIGGTSNQESLDITLDASGNVYTTGWFEGTVDFDPGAGIFNLSATGRDVFISKLDSSGNFLWAKSFGSAGYNQGYSINVDVSGNIYIAGEFYDSVDFDPGIGEFNITAVGFYDIFVLKLDINGDFVWAKSMGGTHVDRGYSVVGSEDGVYLAGTFWDTADFDPSESEYILTPIGGIDGFVVKLSGVGDFVWAKQYRDSLGEAITLDASGNVYTLVRFKGIVDFDSSAAVFNLTSFGDNDVAIVKLNTNGNFIWAKQMGGSGTEEPTEMVIDASGNIYTTGYFSGTADFDPSATQNTLTSQGSFDVFVSKLNADGDYVWAKQIGGTGSDDGKGLDVDNAGNVYASGIFNGTLDADPSANTFPLTSYGDNDVYAIKLDSNGDFVWGTHFGGTAKDLGRAIAVNKTTLDVYVTGTFEGTADFDSSATQTTLTSVDLKDVFIAKLSESSLSAANNLNALNFSQYPNPIEHQLYIKSNSLIKGRVTIVDITGRTIRTWKLNAASTINVFDVEFLPTGTYFLNIAIGTTSYSKKVLKL